MADTILVRNEAGGTTLLQIPPEVADYPADLKSRFYAAQRRYDVNAPQEERSAVIAEIKAVIDEARRRRMN